MNALINDVSTAPSSEKDEERLEVPLCIVFKSHGLYTYLCMLCKVIKRRIMNIVMEELDEAQTADLVANSHLFLFFFYFHSKILLPVQNQRPD